jgi:hypothetical protein
VGTSTPAVCATMACAIADLARRGFTEILYAIESPSGVRGTLADAFGVYADPATGTALRDVPIRSVSAL